MCELKKNKLNSVLNLFYKEDIMLVKVIIKRDISKGKEQQFFPLIRDLRNNAMHQNGYISSEVLICFDNSNRVVSISKWESIEDWLNWKNDMKRKKIDDRLNELQDSPAINEVYVFSKYMAAAHLGFPPPLQKISI